MTWTLFWDMHSGGGLKESFAMCYIEAPEEEAKSVFYSRYNHNPERVTCTCCGGDYSISEEPTLAEASAYHRHCRWAAPQVEGERYPKGGRYLEWDEEMPEGWGYTYPDYHSAKPISLDEYLKSDEVEVIYAGTIMEHERNFDMPDQGYMWVG